MDISENAEAVAGWLENMPHAGIYNESQDLRKAVIDSFKPDRPSWETMTPEKLAGAVKAWLEPKRGGMQPPELSDEELGAAGVAMREWLAQHEAKTKAPALLTVDAFQGALHAFHCSLRGLDMWAEQKANAEKAKQMGGMRGDFNLRG